MKPKKTIYYQDEQNDDFSATNGKVRKKKIKKNYRYIRRGPLFSVAAAVLYRCIATPVAYLFCKLRYGVKIKNASALKGIRGGFFLYGNHTQYAFDAFIPTLLTFPRKTYIITSPDTALIPVVRRLVPMLGAIPLSGTVKGMKNMLSAIERRIKSKKAVTVYPEAHIWPFYNKIRPFGEQSFAYPCKFGVPAVGFVVTYRARKLFKNARPLITVTVSEPIYPAADAGERAERRRLRDEIYNFMSTTCEREGSVAYFNYVKSN